MKLFWEIGAFDLYVLHGVDESKIVFMIDANIPVDDASS